MQDSSEFPCDDAGRLRALDRMMLGIVLEMFSSAARKARFELNDLRRQPMAFLAQAQDIPAAFRVSYADMLSRIGAMVEAIERNMKDLPDYVNTVPDEPMELVWRGRCLRERAGEIRDVVERISATAVKLRLTLDQIAQRLRSLPPSMVAWDNMVEVRVWVDFKPIAERPSYAGCDGGESGVEIEALVAKVSPLVSMRLIPDEDDERGFNWNIRQYHSDHPLSGMFYDYLTHSVTDHTPLPEVLLPWVQDLWFEVYVRGDGYLSQDPNDEGPPSKLPFGPAADTDAA